MPSSSPAGRAPLGLRLTTLGAILFLHVPMLVVLL